MSEQSDYPAEPPLRSEQLRALLSQFKTVNEQIHRLEWQLRDLERELDQLHAEQADMPNQAHLQRARDLSRWKSSLEERIINTMLHADALHAEIEALRR